MKSIFGVIESISGSMNDILVRSQFSWINHWISSILAGLYIGLGIILIFCIGQTVPPEIRPFLMGISFSIALVLVLVAGAYLFTGMTMTMTIRLLTEMNALYRTLTFLAICWIGNLIGSTVLGFLISRLHMPLTSPDSLAHTVAYAKTHMSITELLIRGFFCNLLVCLAIWMYNRLQQESARIMVIWLCLFAFITCGFEHSVANMTLLTLSYFSEGSRIGLMDIAYNLFWVSLGNMLAGIFLGSVYYKIRHQ